MQRVEGADLSACTLLGGTFLTIVELDDGDFTCNENHINFKQYIKICLDLGR